MSMDVRSQAEREARAVQPGWIVSMVNHRHVVQVAYIQEVADRHVTIRRKHPNGEKWMTHRLKFRTFISRFRRKLGETPVCPSCGNVPVEIYLKSVEDGFTNCKCPHCLHEWEREIAEDS